MSLMNVVKVDALPTPLAPDTVYLKRINTTQNPNKFVITVTDNDGVPYDNMSTNDVFSNMKVDTVAALRSIPYTLGMKYVTTMGCLTVGDGGGGVWRWDAASTEVDNVGTVIQPSGHTSAGRWVRVYSGPVSLGWFTNPDAPNIATAFQAAINWVIDSGDELYVPPGTYDYAADPFFIQLRVLGSPTVVKQLSIFGSGRRDTIINVDVEGIAFDVSSTTAGPLTCRNITFQNAKTTDPGRTCFRVWTRRSDTGQGISGARFSFNEVVLQWFTYADVWAVANLNSDAYQTLFIGPESGPGAPPKPFSYATGDSAPVRIWGGSGAPDTTPAQDMFYSNLIKFYQCWFVYGRYGLEVIGSKVALDTCVVEQNWVGIVASGGLASDFTGENAYPACVTLQNTWFEYNYLYHYTPYKVAYPTGTDIVDASLIGKFIQYDNLEQTIVQYDASQTRSDMLVGIETETIRATKCFRTSGKAYNSGYYGAPIQVGGYAGLHVWLDTDNSPRWKYGAPTSESDGVCLSKYGTFTPKMMIGTTESASGGGRFYRVGNMLFYTITFTPAGWTKGQSTGVLTITNLPVACAYSYGMANINASNHISTVGLPTGRIEGGSTTISIKLNETGSVKGLYDVTDTHIVAGPVNLFFYLNGYYMIA